MRILITGASGLIGSALMKFLNSLGHETLALPRCDPQSAVPQACWCPERKEVNFPAEPIDAIIHLAGENIGRRWSSTVKRRIRESRLEGTRLLVARTLQLPKPPQVFLCASATGIYGNRGDELLDERCQPGNGFLADVCREWEAATEPASRSGVRVVNLRFGIVLSGHGGALKKMLPAFRLGLGGKIADGRQYWSWVAIDDLVGVVEFALATNSLKGAVNVVSPNPVRNSEFTHTLAAVLHRPALLTVPKFAIKLLMGEMGEEALLSGCRVAPAKLQQHNFQFTWRDLRPTLEHLLR